MAPSLAAPRPIRRHLGECQRGSHCERHPSPHPCPLPWGEGESSAAFQNNPALCLPDELPEQANLPPAVPSPRGRVRVSGIGLPFDTTIRTLPEIVELRESSGRAGGFP